MPSRFLSRWRGVLLSLIGIVSTVWLAATGQLGLYIHPRYFVFTTVMAVIAAVFALVAFAVLPQRGNEHDHDHGHDHEHDEQPPAPRRGRWGWIIGSAALIAATAASLLVLPPATLTTSTVEQRDINGSASAPDADAPELVGGDYTSFTVKDWAGLLRQGTSGDFLADKTATMVGFVTPDRDDPENIFYVARFVVTCCAVDAQPVGVPVYHPGWADEFEVDEWVSVTGRFVENPSITSTQVTVIEPSDITPAEQPAEPYVY
ncbi:TIGR03943 family putative permease subunit [Amnibacterium flavum]|uniref:TIGR03943 family protein n=1 Tax=Amnibacterium flavum TaxID=2173173 RepID=A0A2V1HZC7_9MICO|nr:TIGR03943 family protein [Amnibacterium flavum]PVZ96064.1 TIGR03943 family protein [Amnibacterium flavum]